jgi:hypothetical protein
MLDQCLPFLELLLVLLWGELDSAQTTVSERKERHNFDPHALSLEQCLLLPTANPETHHRLEVHNNRMNE